MKTAELVRLRVYTEKLDNALGDPAALSPGERGDMAVLLRRYLRSSESLLPDAGEALSRRPANVMQEG